MRDALRDSTTQYLPCHTRAGCLNGPGEAAGKGGKNEIRAVEGCPFHRLLPLFIPAVCLHFWCLGRPLQRQYRYKYPVAVPKQPHFSLGFVFCKTFTHRSYDMKLLVVCLMSVVAVALARPQQQQEPIPIVKQVADIAPDGAYQYSYETGNGIKADEVGSLQPADNPEDGNVVVVQGSYTYTGDDGVVYTVTYTADKEGFKVTGDHIPKK